MGIFLFWIAIGILCAVIAPSRGRSAMAWFFLGFLLSPLALIALLALPNLKAEAQAATLHAQHLPLKGSVDTKECPRCAETIKKAALACRFCGYEYPHLDQKPASGAIETLAISAATQDCPSCHERVPDYARLCRHCGHRFPNDRQPGVTIHPTQG